jgi:hypothetical protein
MTYLIEVFGPFGIFLPWLLVEACKDLLPLVDKRFWLVLGLFLIYNHSKCIA